MGSGWGALEAPQKEWSAKVSLRSCPSWQEVKPGADLGEERPEEGRASAEALSQERA